VSRMPRTNEWYRTEFKRLLRGVRVSHADMQDDDMIGVGEWLRIVVEMYECEDAEADDDT